MVAGAEIAQRVHDQDQPPHAGNIEADRRGAFFALLADMTTLSPAVSPLKTSTMSS